jgi:hypothetical protein
LNTLCKALLAASVAGALLTVFVVVALSRPSDGGLRLRWAGAEGLAGGAVQATDGGGSLATVVYIYNDTGEPLRDASLRFYPNRVAAPAGFSLGTVANVSSHFDGSAQVWPLGDIAPGTRLIFNLGLWFDGSAAVNTTDDVGLTIQLASPDLAAPLTSNQLQVNLIRSP